MNNDIVVLDTNIWINALSDEGNADYKVNCLCLLTDFMQTKLVKLAVDSDNIILTEYGDNLNSNKTFQMLIQQLFKENRFYYTDGKTSSKMRKGLLESGFHEKEDHTFVATAYNSGRYIISDDSDYGTHNEMDKKEAYGYITEKLHIRLENSEQGLKSFQGMMQNKVNH